MLDYAASLDFVAAGLSRVADFGTRQLLGFVQAASRLEDVRNAFITTEGSITAADIAIGKIRRAALDPGLSFESVLRATRRFRSYGVSVDDAIAITRGFSNAARLTGTSTREFDEGLRQLAKSIGTGKIEQDDLNAITERFGPISQRIRAEFGATGQEVTMSLQAAGKSVTDFALELADLDKQQQAINSGLSVAISNLENAWQTLQQALGTELLPLATRFVEVLTDMVGYFNDLPPSVRTTITVAAALTTGLAALGAAAATLGTGLAALVTIFGTSAVVAGAAAAATVTGVIALAVTTVTAAVTAFHELNNTVEAIAARQGGLGKITSATTEATEAAKNFVPVIQLTAEAMTEVAAQAENAERAIVGFDRAAFRASPPPAPRATTPPAFTRRSAQTGTQRTGFVPVAPAPPDQFGIRPLENLEAFHRRSTTLIRVQWSDTYEAIESGWNQAARTVQRTGNNVLSTINNRLQAAINLNRLQLRDSVDASTRQFQALGDLSQLSFDYYDRVRTEQDAYTTSVNRTQIALTNLSSTLNSFALQTEGTFRRVLLIVANITNLIRSTQQLQRSRQGISAGEQGSTLNLVSSVVDIGLTIGQLATLFHDPANDRLAEQAGFRAFTSGGSFPIGTIRAIRRQNATDFSESFARGAQRAVAARGPSGEEQEITVVTQLVMNDRTVQEVTRTVNRLEQSGRAQLRR